MEIVRITTTDESLYKAFREIYDISFPVFEQRTEVQQKDAFADSRFYLDCYVGKNTGFLQGFIAYWRFDGYIYVEHFAIHPNERGKGLGGFILKNLIEQEGGRVLLEIDPVVDSISAARLRFYQSYGFVENPFPHIHPAYRNEYPDHSLVVLSTEGEMTASEYNKFASDLNMIVMKKGM
ncbi:GNAT family N-acetyltransferase [Parabacteroides timonensis]|uniref:GNAT family N-acetyltransferase n=1 Tax=Parabacteroides timonensis TaxID=1871013 RepID=UPI00094E6C1E|nr:GNAT family N-acetyltransferase [Parabacteroides timonensis]